MSSRRKWFLAFAASATYVTLALYGYSVQVERDHRAPPRETSGRIQAEHQTGHGGTTTANLDTRGWSCGPAALLAAGATYGANASLRLRSVIEHEGLASRAVTSLYELAHCARQAGFEPLGVKVDAQHLGLLPLPAIVHVEPDHFLTLTRVRDDIVVIVDQGATYALPRAEFQRRFHGHALCLRR